MNPLKKLFFCSMAATTFLTPNRTSALANYPSPYTPPTLNLPLYGLKDNTSQISFEFNFGNATSALDDAGQTTSAFSGHGPIRFKNWSTANFETTSKTYTFLNNPVVTGEDVDDGTSSKIGGRAIIDGKAEFKQATIKLKHVIDSGLFAEIKIPFRMLRSGEYSFKAEPGSTTKTALLDVLNEKNSTLFTDLLAEQGYEPLSSEFSANGLSDVVVGGGWQGQEFYQDYFLHRVSGQLQAGIIAPTSQISQPQKEYLFSLPMGHNEHFGVEAHGALEVELSPYIAFGGTAMSQVFFRQSRTMKVKTDKEQNGPLFLSSQIIAKSTTGTKEAKIDKGSTWNVAGYLRFGIPKFGINGLVGYSYHSNEKTNLLQTERQQKNNGGHPPQPLHNSIINSDRQLEEWNQHVISGAILVEPLISEDRTFRPRIEFSYHHPVAGKHSPITILKQIGMSAAVAWDI